MVNPWFINPQVMVDHGWHLIYMFDLRANRLEGCYLGCWFPSMRTWDIWVHRMVGATIWQDGLVWTNVDHLWTKPIDMDKYKPELCTIVDASSDSIRGSTTLGQDTWHEEPSILTLHQVRRAVVWDGPGNSSKNRECSAEPIHRGTLRGPLEDWLSIRRKITAAVVN